ncbi:AT-rich interactive domain-containing protein 5A isoform X2 [Gallus gallus]|uniref:AT-rich interactive domain-containing protein 5A isoform X2 n=1 Tax=Gallus gallus TaxID=9031 RepID=UPI001AEADB7A|nr:AT-rich interactive domain-containing protein 5A isoform X2 [Gallus gallus]
MEDGQEQHGGGEEPPASTEPTESPSPEQAKPADASGEKEEEEAFLVSLYKFMKERHTPIERIPHLGFKQINLWKIYKAVEKLGAYELVTGRRLWKNVYDELGGSPGSTSAATCTRRHYERLVLPYVRHLKGEDDKPLPPSKPRKQYKVSKGTETGEKSRRSKKEKGREQVAPEKAKPEVAATPGASKEEPAEAQEQGQPAEGCASPTAPAPSPSSGCPSTCRAHAEAYKRLFSSFYSKGNHPIMSPLAKKKLLAQVSKAESLHCLKRHCLEGREVASSAHPNPEPSRPAVSPHLKEQRSPETQGLKDTPRGGQSEAGPIPSTSPGRTDRQPYPRAEDGGSAPAVFTGFFHAYRNEVLKPISCHPFGGYFSNLKDFLEPQPEDTEAGREQPQDLRSKAWSRESPQPAAFAAIKACWVPPRAGFAPLPQSPTPPTAKRSRDEEALGPSRKLQVVSPLSPRN